MWLQCYINEAKVWEIFFFSFEVKKKHIQILNNTG